MATVDVDDLLTLKSSEQATDGFDGNAEVIRDILAWHGEIELFRTAGLWIEAEMISLVEIELVALLSQSGRGTSSQAVENIVVEFIAKEH